MEYRKGLSKTVLYCAIMRSYIHHIIYITNQFNNQFLFGFLVNWFARCTGIAEAKVPIPAPEIVQASSLLRNFQYWT